jgi:hypothetical protein
MSNAMRPRWHFRWGWVGPKNYYLPAWLFSVTVYRFMLFVRCCGFYFAWDHCRVLVRCEKCGWIDARYVGHDVLRPSAAEVDAALARLEGSEVSR